MYVNGKPYCLRQKGMSLRNIKAYSGINWDRLLLLEDRLKNDVINELEAGEGRLLLHTETSDGTVIPIWEEAAPTDVDTIQEIMSNIGVHRLSDTNIGANGRAQEVENPEGCSIVSYSQEQALLGDAARMRRMTYLE